MKKKNIVLNRFIFIWILYLVFDFLITNAILFLIESNYLFFSFSTFPSLKTIFAFVIVAFGIILLSDNDKITTKLKKILIIGCLSLFIIPYFFSGNFTVANEQKIVKRNLGIKTDEIFYEDIEKVELDTCYTSTRNVGNETLVYKIYSKKGDLIEIEFPEKSSSIFMDKKTCINFDKFLSKYVDINIKANVNINDIYSEKAIIEYYNTKYNA